MIEPPAVSKVCVEGTNTVVVGEGEVVLGEEAGGLVVAVSGGTVVVVVGGVGSVVLGVGSVVIAGLELGGVAGAGAGDAKVADPRSSGASVIWDRTLLTAAEDAAVAAIAIASQAKISPKRFRMATLCPFAAAVGITHG